MHKEEIILLQYKDVLERLKNKECHLLLGNGFNNWLGVKTRYEDIFERMLKDQRSVYWDAKDIIAECDYDLECFIGKLTQDIGENTFLKKYIENKVKYDFMKATHEIVKNGIRNIYSKQNEGIYILLQNFKNYFTLNFDSFLYLLLLKYKWWEKDATIALQPTFNFIEEDTNETLDSTIYTDIKNARNNGSIVIHFGENTVTASTKKLAKAHFKKEVKTYAKENWKNWSDKDIKAVVDRVWEEEKNKKVLEIVDDGSRPQKLFDDVEYIFDVESETQNLFFLHWAFHIFRDWVEIKKITQTDNDALYDRLEEILNDGDKEILCVFQSENKLDEINKNEYLRKALDKVSTLRGDMVIIWVWLSDNDQHIFDQINHSSLENIYIASSLKKYKETFRQAKQKFWSKNIILFDRDTITYKAPNQPN
jgi:hypothetical protein